MLPEKEIQHEQEHCDGKKTHHRGGHHIGVGTRIGFEFVFLQKLTQIGVVLKINLGAKMFTGSTFFKLGPALKMIVNCSRLGDEFQRFGTIYPIILYSLMKLGVRHFQDGAAWRAVHESTTDEGGCRGQQEQRPPVELRVATIAVITGAGTFRGVAGI